MNTHKIFLRGGKEVFFDFPQMEPPPGADYKAIRSRFYEKASAHPAASEDEPRTVFENVHLYEKCHPEQDLILFIHIFNKFGNIRKLCQIHPFGTTAADISKKCAMYGITDKITRKEDMTLSRIIRAFPVHTAEVVMKEQFQGILPHSLFFQQDLPLVMQHNIFPGLLVPFVCHELREIAEVLNMEISVKLARPEEKKNFMMKTVDSSIKYSRKHVKAYMLSRLDDEREKMRILIKAGIVEVNGKEFQLTPAIIVLVNKLKNIKSVYGLKYSEALDKIKEAK